jgi:hypothetical protein
VEEQEPSVVGFVDTGSDLEREEGGDVSNAMIHGGGGGGGSINLEFRIRGGGGSFFNPKSEEDALQEEDQEFESDFEPEPNEEEAYGYESGGDRCHDTDYFTGSDSDSDDGTAVRKKNIANGYAKAKLIKKGLTGRKVHEAAHVGDLSDSDDSVSMDVADQQCVAAMEEIERFENFLPSPEIPRNINVGDGRSAATAVFLPGSPECKGKIDSGTSVAATPGNTTDLTQSTEAQEKKNKIIPTTQHPVSWPDFKDDIRSMTQEELSLLDWMTEDLRNEVLQHHPKKKDINQDSNDRDKTVMVAQTEKMFPSGRLFASVEQLKQAAKLFGENWGFMTNYTSHSIRCSYNRDLSKKGKNKNLNPTLKDSVDCKFCLKISFFKRPRAEKKSPSLWFQCKITTCNYEHKCNCNPSSHRVARTLSHKNIPSRFVLHDVVKLMRSCPTLDNKTLRDMLRPMLPQFQELSAQKLYHFRRALNRYVFKGEADLGADELLQLQDSFIQGKPAYLEYSVIMDSEMMRHNFKEMLREVMQANDDTWIAEDFLKKAKEALHGFDYRIWRDDRGRPTGLMWMTPEMRRNAARYSSVVCLDAQKRQMNSSGWPYIAPVVKDSEFKVAEMCAAIVLEESTAAYCWTLNAAAQIEPEFKLEEVKIFFGDEGVHDAIAVELGISDTVIIHGDHYHLFNQVWPNHFSASIWTEVKPFLGNMFFSSCKETFMKEYVKARNLPGIRENPKHLDFLKKVYSNPKRYAGYIRRGVEGHMEMLGSSSSEQNHSSVTARLGKGGVGCLSVQIEKLFNRDGDRAREKSNRMASWNAFQQNFVSKFNAPTQIAIDKKACRVLTQFAFVSLFKKSRKRSFKQSFSSRIGNNGYKIVYPDWAKQIDAVQTLYEAHERKDLQVVMNGHRCPCSRRTAWLIQCEHELTIDKKFVAEKYDRRWYSEAYLKDNNIQFECHSTQHGVPIHPIHVPAFSPGRGPANRNAAVPLSSHNSPAATAPAQFENMESPQSPVVPRATEKLTHKHLLHHMTRVVSACQSDQKAMRAVFVVVNDMFRFCEGKHFDFKLVRTCMNSTEVHQLQNPSNDQPFQRSNPVSGTTRAIPNHRNISRKRSSAEIETSKGNHLYKIDNNRKKAPPNSKASDANQKKPPPNSRASDAKHLLGYQNNPGKACSFCKDGGHQINKCPKIIVHGGTPLPRDGSEAAVEMRNALSLSLSVPNHWITLFQQGDETTTKKFHSGPPPQKTRGIVIYRRLFKNSLKPYNIANNFCFECNFLDLTGDLLEGYPEKSFYDLQMVQTFITKCKNNTVINLMRLEVTATPPCTTPPVNPNILPVYSCPSTDSQMKRKSHRVLFPTIKNESDELDRSNELDGDEESLFGNL